MGHGLYAGSAPARNLFDAADKQLGFTLSTICFTGPAETLTDTVFQQPALFVTSLAAWETMCAQAWERPHFMAGHSLGEFTALTAAGSLTFADGLRLVQRRAELMQAAGAAQPGAMAAILALETAAAAAICAQATAETGLPVQLANDNCPGQVVISGHAQALARALELAQAAGARKLVRLPISIAAHSALMASAAAEFAQAVDNTPIQTPQIPIIGNVTAQPLTTADAIRAELKAQLTAPVAWDASMRYLLAQDVTRFVEVGPGSVLLGLVKRIARGAQRIPFDAGKEA
jgi:[acyl-carrier-protein] S-malonyltransferase